jgi:hypothetical protein
MNTDTKLGNIPINVGFTQSMLDVMLDYGSPFFLIKQVVPGIYTVQDVEDPDGDGGEFTVYTSMIVTAVAKIVHTMQGTFACRYWMDAIMQQDAGHIDAEAADVAWQMAALGEVMYG